jgi:DNA/RNA-binding protein KIN17
MEQLQPSQKRQLQCRHPHVRIEAHKVYNEYIQDKHHVHMNSTKWLTLTEYVKYLGREGLCKVEDTPKGWFIQLIHRDLEQVWQESTLQ